jgi:hypothetical protein
MDETGAVVVEASSENHGVSIWSEAHLLSRQDKPSRYEKVILSPAALRRPADAA